MDLKEEQLKQNMATLDKLKANIHVHAIQQYVDLLRKRWKPRTTTVQTSRGEGLLYYDEYSCRWATEDMAFRGYVFNHIARIIDKQSK